MRKLQRLLLYAAALLALLPALAVPCLAAEELDVEDAGRALPEGAAEALEGLAVGDAELDGGLERIGAFIRERFGGALKEALVPLGAVLAVTVLCAAAQQLDFRAKDLGFDFVAFGGCLAIAAATVTDLRSAVALGEETVRALGEYSHALLPTLTTAAVMAGATVSAGAKYAAAALLSDVLLTAAESLILPLICAYAATVAAEAALGTDQLASAAKLLQWLIKTLMKALVIAFTGYLTLTGVLKGTADAAVVKAAKSALSAALPVVGRTISDAADSLVAGAGLARNAIGSFGMLAVLAAVALPVLRLGLRVALYKAVAAVAGVVCGGRLAKLLEGVGNACSMLLGLVGAAAAFEFLAVVSLLQTVTG